MKVGKRILIAAFMMAVIVTGSSMQADAIGKFDPAFYAAKYPDVWAAFGADQVALYNHYITIGQREGRIPFSGAVPGEAVEISLSTIEEKGKFNAVYYATKYPDVAAAIGTDAQALYNHYITYGQKEMRIPYPDAAPGEAVNGIATAETMAMQTARKPVTYIVKYVVTDAEEGKSNWRCQTGTSIWKSDSSNRSVYYLERSVQEGDMIVIETSAGNPALTLKVPVSLSNVTFTGSGEGIVTAKSIKDVYVLQSATGIVNGDVTNACVYDDGIANFNNSVSNLYIKDASSDKQTVAVAGRVDYAEWSVKDRITRQLFSFSKGTFSQKEGVLKTEERYYSTFPR